MTLYCVGKRRVRFLKVPRGARRHYDYQKEKGRYLKLGAPSHPIQKVPCSRCSGKRK